MAFIVVHRWLPVFHGSLKILFITCNIACMLIVFGGSLEGDPASGALL